MSKNIPEHLKQKKIVDAIVNDPKNQTLTSGEIIQAKVLADKLEAERYDPVMERIDNMFNLLLEQMVKENQ
jgi:hypothetical protein